MVVRRKAQAETIAVIIAGEGLTPATLIGKQTGR